MKNKTPDFAYHMTKFFTEYLPIQRNLSPNSIATYRDTFRLLLLFYDTEKHIMVLEYNHRHEMLNKLYL